LTEENLKETKVDATYGFNNQYSGHFLHVQNLDVVSLENIEEKNGFERWEQMRLLEDAKFDREWYLADLLESPSELNEILEFIPEINKDPFTSEEQASLRNLGNKECTHPGKLG